MSWAIAKLHTEGARESIREILLPDGWHEIRKGTFNFDAYSGVLATGFCFDEHDGSGPIIGPLTSILAIRT